MTDESPRDDGSAVTEVDYVVLPAGRKIGRFEVVSVLGQGSFGITYRARDRQLGRDVAIKEYLPAALAIRSDGTTVRPRSTATAEDFLWGRERFVEEGRTIATLHDAPGIVRVFDFLEANGTAYIVMELVRGETLDARLRRDGMLDAAAVERILGPLLNGLEQVHAAGFLHRDIKPGNILLDGRGNPTLIDFGASRAAMANRTVAMTAIFTPGYAAVEQFTSAKQGPWTDIYGVSATLYHAIAGKAPPSAIDRMLDDTCVPLGRLAAAGFPAGLLAGIDAGLAVRAAERPQSIAAWRGVLGGSDATVALPRPARVAMRNRRPLWIGAAAAAVLLLAGGGYVAFELAKPAATSSAAGDRQRIEQEVRRAREALASAEQASQRRAEQDAREKVAADAADKQRTDESAQRQAVAQTDPQRQEAEAARQKADAEAAERARIQQEVTKAREALAQAEAVRQQAEAETARLQAEAETRQKAVAEAAARAQAEAEAAEKQKADADAAARQQADAEAVAKQKADAEAATKQKSDDELRKAGEAAEAALRLSVLDRQRLQVALTSLGFDTRGADGAFGPRSREMIAGWQRRQNQPPTGYLTAAQQQALLREAAPAVSKYDDDQKKAEEGKRKAEEDAKARALQQPPTAPAAAPAAAPAPQAPAGSRDGLWFGAIDCKQSGRQSVQGSVSNGSGRLSGNNLQLTLTISGASASIAVSSQHAGGPNGQLSGELRGRSVYAKGLLPRFAGGHDECSVSLVGP